MRLAEPYSVLYEIEGADLKWGEICRSGPFLSYEEAMANIRLLNGKDFDLNEQFVYIVTPDHRLILIESDDLETEGA